MLPKPSHIAPNSKTDSGLPDFLHPPVDEVAISLQFSTIAGFGVPHFGLYWERVRSDYPRFEIQPPLANITEQLGSSPIVGRRVEIALNAAPKFRCWYLDQSGNRLIQLQHDRFVHNWRKINGTESYPRYPALRGYFEKEWERFSDYLKSEKLEHPKINQCEVTYVNHIEYEKGWNGYGELDKVVAALATPKQKNRFLPHPERVSMQVTYGLEENAGRLHVSFAPVIRARDGKEVLQMTLTARGAPKSGSDEDIFAWLDLGRKWIVRGFADFTTDSIQRVWGRQ